MLIIKRRLNIRPLTPIDRGDALALTQGGKDLQVNGRVDSISTCNTTPVKQRDGQALCVASRMIVAKPEQELSAFN